MRWLAAALVAGTIAGAALWWWWPEGGAGGWGTVEAGADREPPRITVAEPTPGGDGGVRGALTLRAQDPAEHPAAGVEITVYERETSEVERATAPDGERILDCVDWENQELVLGWLRDPAHAPRVLARGTTGLDGTASFPGLPPGQLMVTARGPDGALAEGAVSEDPEDEPEPLVMQPPATLVLQVEDDFEKEIAGAKVELISQRTLERRELVADGHGMVQVPGIAETSVWRVVVGAAGYGLWQSAEVTPAGASAEDPLLVSLDRVHVLVVQTRSGGRPVAAAVELSDGASVVGHQQSEGTVRFEAVRGTEVTVTASAPGLASSPVTVELVEGPNEVTIELRGAARVLASVTDAQGQPVLAMATLTCADTTVEVTGSELGALLILGPVGEGACSLEVATDAPQSEGYEIWKKELDLAPGDHHVEVVLGAARQRAEPEIRGLVVDAQGRPVEGALVESDDREATSASDGTFVLKMPRETPQVAISGHHPAAGDASAMVQVPTSHARLQLALKVQLEVELLGLPPGGQADVAVRSLKSGTDLRTQHQSADERGRASFSFQEGRCEVEVSTDERLAPPPVSLELRPGSPRTVQIKLLPGASVHGRVEVEGAKEVPEDLEVMLQARSGPGVERWQHVAIEEDGRFEAKGLDPSRSYPFSVKAESAWNVDAPHQVTPGPAAVVVKLRQQPLITGRVVDEAGRPLRTFDMGPTTFDTVDGTFELAHPESEALTVTAEGFATRIVAAPVPRKLGDVVMARAPTVKGLVVAGDGRPVPGVQITAQGATAMTGADGTFSIAVDLQAGDEPVEIVARRGSRRGVARADVARQVRIVLEATGRLRGQIVDAQGRGTPAMLTVLDPEGEDRSVDTDGQGRFDTELPQGLVEVRVPALDINLVVRVTADTPPVVLGPTPGTCSLEVAAAGRAEVEAVRLLRTSTAQASGEAAQREGQVNLIVTPDGLAFGSGIACGTYLMEVSGEDWELSQQVQLRGHEAIEVTPPPPRPERAQAEGDGR